MGYGDPFDVMGSSGFATDLNCFNKWKLGWLEPEEVSWMFIDETSKTITVNPLGHPYSPTKCGVIEIPHMELADNLTFELNRIFFEYRKPEGITDRYLEWLRDGGSMLSRFSDLPNVNIEGILVRAATWDPVYDCVSLFDAHPEEMTYKELGIRHTWNIGRFVDSFLNVGEVMELPDPINLRLEVVEHIPGNAEEDT